MDAVFTQRCKKKKVQTLMCEISEMEKDERKRSGDVILKAQKIDSVHLDVEFSVGELKAVMST